MLYFVKHKPTGNGSIEIRIKDENDVFWEKNHATFTELGILPNKPAVNLDNEHIHITAPGAKKIAEFIPAILSATDTTSIDPMVFTKLKQFKTVDVEKENGKLTIAKHYNESN